METLLWRALHHHAPVSVWTKGVLKPVRAPLGFSMMPPWPLENNSNSLSTDLRDASQGSPSAHCSVATASLPSLLSNISCFCPRLGGGFSQHALMKVWALSNLTIPTSGPCAPHRQVQMTPLHRCPSQPRSSPKRSFKSHHEVSASNTRRN